jgi:hypothetical protein
MLSQESITAVLPTRTKPEAVEYGLLAGTQDLIREIHQRLPAGNLIDNRILTEFADKAYGGSRARGAYTVRDAYDALEAAVNKLLESQAQDVMTMSVPDPLREGLRPQTERLPRQADRTRDQVLLQQFSTPPAIAYVAARLINPSSTDIVSNHQRQLEASRFGREPSARLS